MIMLHAWCFVILPPVTIHDDGGNITNTWDRVHNPSFSSKLKNKPNKLECCISPHCKSCQEQILVVNTAPELHLKAP
jgi:hypothetical protein